MKRPESLGSKRKRLERKRLKRKPTITKVIFAVSLFCALCWVAIFILIKFMIN